MIRRRTNFKFSTTESSEGLRKTNQIEDMRLQRTLSLIEREHRHAQTQIRKDIKFVQDLRASIVDINATIRIIRTEPVDTSNNKQRAPKDDQTDHFTTKPPEVVCDSSGEDGSDSETSEQSEQEECPRLHDNRRREDNIPNKTERCQTSKTAPIIPLWQQQPPQTRAATSVSMATMRTLVPEKDQNGRAVIHSAPPPFSRPKKRRFKRKCRPPIQLVARSFRQIKRQGQMVV